MTCGENGGEELICFYLLNLGEKVEIFESVLKTSFYQLLKEIHYIWLINNGYHSPLGNFFSQGRQSICNN